MLIHRSVTRTGHAFTLFTIQCISSYLFLAESLSLVFIREYLAIISSVPLDRNMLELLNQRTQIFADNLGIYRMKN